MTNTYNNEGLLNSDKLFKDGHFTMLKEHNNKIIPYRTYRFTDEDNVWMTFGQLNSSAKGINGIGRIIILERE